MRRAPIDIGKRRVGLLHADAVIWRRQTYDVPRFELAFQDYAIVPGIAGERAALRDAHAHRVRTRQGQLDGRDAVGTCRRELQECGEREQECKSMHGSAPRRY